MKSLQSDALNPVRSGPGIQLLNPRQVPRSLVDPIDSNLGCGLPRDVEEFSGAIHRKRTRHLLTRRVPDHLQFAGFKNLESYD